MKHSSRLKARRVAAAIFTLGGSEVKASVELVGALRESIVDTDTLDVDGIYGKQYGGTPKVIVMMGDSLVAGDGVKEGEQTSAAHLANWVADAEQSPVRLINVAFPGAKGSDLKGQIHDLEKLLRGVKPDLVFVSMGANDVRLNTSLGEARTPYREAVLKLNRMGARVVWATVPPMNAPVPLARTLIPGWAIRRRGDAWSERTEAFLNNIARQGHGVTVVPLHEVMAGFCEHPELFANNKSFHPGVEGQWEAARRVWPYIQEALAKRGDPHPQQANFDASGGRIQGRERPPSSMPSPLLDTPKAASRPGEIWDELIADIEGLSQGDPELLRYFSALRDVEISGSGAPASATYAADIEADMRTSDNPEEQGAVRSLTASRQLGNPDWIKAHALRLASVRSGGDPALEQEAIGHWEAAAARSNHDAHGNPDRVTTPGEALVRMWGKSGYPVSSGNPSRGQSLTRRPMPRAAAVPPVGPRRSDPSTGRRSIASAPQPNNRVAGRSEAGRGF